MEPARNNERRGVTEPFTFVIFGASGDLARRKLIPSIYSLFREGLLAGEFTVLGAARSDYTDGTFRAYSREGVTPADAGDWERFAAHLRYQRLSYDSADDFRSLRRTIESFGADAHGGHGAEDVHGGELGNCLFYLAVPPAMISVISEQLRESGLARQGAVETPWSRIIVEKPFGRDLGSARALNGQLGAAFAENQIFRIDHYLGKETVQNILVLRFANSIFEPLWNQKYVDHVQITVSETVGVEGRGGYYEQAGALRDIVQNHMMHLLCMVAMEAPGSLAPAAVRDEKVKLLRALRPIPPECAANGVVRAQYAAGTCRGVAVPGYREEEGVAADSMTETYVAFKAQIDNWRWAGVPFYMRTGKRLPARITEVSVHFKAVPQVLFNAPPIGPMPPNVLAIRVQPNEGISMRFQVKVPGQAMRIEPFQMDFGYSDAFGKEPPEAYERLLLDALLGDPTLFTRGDEVEAAWQFVAPVIEGCEATATGGKQENAELRIKHQSSSTTFQTNSKHQTPMTETNAAGMNIELGTRNSEPGTRNSELRNEPPSRQEREGMDFDPESEIRNQKSEMRELPTYPAGTWGPKEADELIEADGRSWLVLRRPKHKRQG